MSVPSIPLGDDTSGSLTVCGALCHCCTRPDCPVTFRGRFRSFFLPRHRDHAEYLLGNQIIGWIQLGQLPAPRPLGDLGLPHVHIWRFDMVCGCSFPGLSDTLADLLPRMNPTSLVWLPFPHPLARLLGLAPTCLLC